MNSGNTFPKREYINNKDLINQTTVGNRGDKFAYDIWNLKKFFDENKDVYEDVD